MAQENEETPVEQTEDEPTAPDTPPTQEPGPTDSPWAADLQKHFDDPQLQRQVDGFLRETVQPYVTQLEQKSQPSRDAERLWNDFSTDPNNTFHAVAVELYGKDTADKLTSAITGEGGDTEVTDTDTTDSDFKVDPDELPDEVREAVDFVNQERQQREWDSAFKEVAFDEDGNQIIDEELFYPFVTAADGDIDAAKDAYLAWQGQAKEKFGLNVPNPEDTPPPTIDPNKGGGTSAPPQQKEYKDIDDAIDDFFAEQNAPPTV